MERYKDCEGKFGSYIMQDLRLPAVQASPKMVADNAIRGQKFVHWMDNENMPGSIQINTCWLCQADRDYLLGPNALGKWQTHVHDADEIVCYYGMDPEHPEELGGEIEMMIGDESHILTKSSMIFLPAGLPHSRPLVNRADRPIFHFSLILKDSYSFVSADGTTLEDEARECGVFEPEG